MKLAIRGNESLGNKILDVLYTFGAKRTPLKCDNSNWYYYIGDDNIIESVVQPSSDMFCLYDISNVLPLIQFKVSDNVRSLITNEKLVVESIFWDEQENTIKYKVRDKDGDVYNYTNNALVGVPSIEYDLRIAGSKDNPYGVLEILQMLGGINSAQHNGDGYDGSFNGEGKYYISDACDKSIIVSAYNDTNFYDMTVEQYWEKFPFRVGDQAKFAGNVCTITNAVWNKRNACVSYTIEYNNFIYTVQANNLERYLTGKDIDLTSCTEHAYKINLGDYELKEIDGQLYAVKKSKYPTSFENVDGELESYKKKQFDIYKKLLMCRDEWWRIYDNWTPNWEDGMQQKFCIHGYKKNLSTEISYFIKMPLAFPTAEMRDEFMYWFKDDILACIDIV